jgi:hypothetical protein
MRNAVAAASVGLCLLAMSATRVSAQVAGPWHVTGEISGHGFILDCRFAPVNARFSGTCIEAGGADSRVKPGKVHTLSQGTINGQQIRWAYPVSVMFLSFDLSFAGTLAGDTMSGVVSASGRKGEFTAIRK